MVTLASASPRRREIMDMLGIPYICQPSHIEEVHLDEWLPEDLVVNLARQKCEAVAGESPQGRIVVSADTVVAMEEFILGKPQDRPEAFWFLKKLAGSTHSVHTGLCIMKAGTRDVYESSVETKVRFRELTDLEIDRYLDTMEYEDKAGAYAIQGKGSMLVDRIEGDYFNVVGLSVADLLKGLAHFGIEPMSWLQP